VPRAPEKNFLTTDSADYTDFELESAPARALVIAPRDHEIFRREKGKTVSARRRKHYARRVCSPEFIRLSGLSVVDLPLQNL